MVDLYKVLQEQAFESVDEANDFLNKMMHFQVPEPLWDNLSPVEQAQQLMYDAWDSSGKARVKLARRALAISKDCADAYVLLAEETARTLEEATEFYRQGVQAGERALGPEIFEEEVEHFWGILETRPYMRAREGLAACLWQLGDLVDHGESLRRVVFFSRHCSVSRESQGLSSANPSQRRVAPRDVPTLRTVRYPCMDCHDR